MDPKYSKDWFRSIYDDLWLSHIFTDHVRSTTEGYVFTGACLLTPGEGYPSQVPTANGGKGTQRYIPPSQVQMGGEGTPRYLPSIQVKTGGYPKVPKGTQRYIPPSQVQMGGEGTPRYLPSIQVKTGGYPKVPTPGQGIYAPPARPDGIGQHMEYLIRRSRYASCVHPGGLSCFNLLKHLKSKRLSVLCCLCTI